MLIGIMMIMSMKPHSSHGQDLDGHRWKDRVVILLSEEADSEVVNEQLRAFKSEEEGMRERKIVVYVLSPHGYRVGLNDENAWQKGSPLYSRLKRNEEAPFEIVLVGLDGGVKLRQHELLTVRKLFATIDAMPMRQSEMREQRKR